MYKYMSKKHMENWTPNNRKTCIGEGPNADEKENGDSEEQGNADYHDDDNKTSGSFGDIHVATATLTTTMIIGIQSRWWRLGFQIV